MLPVFSGSSERFGVQLDSLFRPRSVAFVGATPDMDRYSGRVVQYCARAGFNGQVYAVNPKYRSIGDIRCYPDLASVDGPIDVVVILVGPARIPSLLEQCQAKGVRFAIAIGDLVPPNSAEADARLQDLRRQLAGGGPRIIGPVCVGLLSPHVNLALTISSGMSAGPPRAGGIGLISQSGGVMSAILDRAHQFGSGFSALVSSGLEFDLNVCDFAEYLLDDTATRCIAIYAERIQQPRRFFALAERARQARKPILVLKAGWSEVGARSALTHSGAIAGDRDIEDAAFRRHGIVRVTDIDDLHMSAELLCRAADGPQGGVAVVSQSGGFGAVVADVLTDARVPFAEPTPETVRRILAETPVPAVGNPHDSASGPPGNNAPSTCASLLAFQDDPQVGVTLYAEMMYMQQDQGHSLQKVVMQYGIKPHVVCWQSGQATDSVIASLRSDGVLTFDNLRATASALSALYRFRWFAAEQMDVVAPDLAAPASAPPLPDPAGILDVRSTRSLLSSYGIPLLSEIIVSTPDEAVEAATRLGFPVALKGLAEGVAHKTERGFVALNLCTREAVAHACSGMAEHGEDHLQGYLLQPMLSDGIEFVVGVRVDATMGPAVLLGLGGIFVEAFGKPVIEMAPISRAVASSMIATLDRKGILNGYRTGRALDADALVATLVAVGRLAWATRDRIDEMDLNPVIVTTRGAFAVDALISLRAAPKVSSTTVLQ